jgi:hypothetical protein
LATTFGNDDYVLLLVTLTGSPLQLFPQQKVYTKSCLLSTVVKQAFSTICPITSSTGRGAASNPKTQQLSAFPISCGWTCCSRQRQDPLAARASAKPDFHLTMCHPGLLLREPLPNQVGPPPRVTLGLPFGRPTKPDPYQKSSYSCTSYQGEQHAVLGGWPRGRKRFAICPPRRARLALRSRHGRAFRPVS